MTLEGKGSRKFRPCPPALFHSSPKLSFKWEKVAPCSSLSNTIRTIYCETATHPMSTSSLLWTSVVFQHQHWCVLELGALPCDSPVFTKHVHSCSEPQVRESDHPAAGQRSQLAAGPPCQRARPELVATHRDGEIKKGQIRDRRGGLYPKVPKRFTSHGCQNELWGKVWIPQGPRARGSNHLPGGQRRIFAEISPPQ